MRVLHVIAGIAPMLGGPSNVTHLIAALNRAGCQAELYTTTLGDRGTLVPYRRASTLDNATLDNLKRSGAIQFFSPDWPSRYGCSWALATALRSDIPKFDLVHLHSLYLFHTMIGGAVCRRYGIPYIIRPHGTLSLRQRAKSRWLKALYSALIEKRNLIGASAIHYTTEEEAKFARTAGVITPGFVLPMGIDLEEFSTLPQLGRFRATHPELRDRRLIVFMGRISEKKGFDLLVPAFAKVAKQISDAQLVVAGPDADGYRATVEMLVKRAGLRERVTWLGPVTGAAKLHLLHDADIFVLPSHDENFGIAAVEAMAAESPVVITPGVALREFAAQAGAVHVAAAERDALADAIIYLLRDNISRVALAKCGRAFALRELTWDAIAKRLMTIYRNIMETASSAATRPRHVTQ